jgi:hypothetical protein
MLAGGKRRINKQVQHRRRERAHDSPTDSEEVEEDEVEDEDEDEVGTAWKRALSDRLPSQKKPSATADTSKPNTSARTSMMNCSLLNTRSDGVSHLVYRAP